MRSLVIRRWISSLGRIHIPFGLGDIKMIESILLAIIGIPIVLVAILVWMCCIIAVLDAVRTYTVGESKPLGKMLGRMKRDK